MGDKKPNDPAPAWIHWTISAALIVVVALLDVARPFGHRLDIFYLLPALYVAWTVRGRMEWAFYAALLLAVYCAPLVDKFQFQTKGYGAFNRSLGVLLGTLMIFLMWERRRAAAALRRANEELEKQVAARTAELTEANQLLRQEVAERRQSEERFASFMQHLPGLAWIKDGELRYVYVNDALEMVFRVPRTELYGKTDEQFLPLETARQFSTNDRAVLARNAGVLLVETLTHEDGTLHHSLVSKFPIPGADGAAPLVGGIAIDITERKQAEDALREMENRLQQAQKMEAIGQLAGGIAHDFNNLLTIINGYSELVLADLRARGDPLQEHVVAIGRAGDRAASLTRQLLAFGRKQILQPKVLDLNAVLRVTEKMLRRLIGEDVVLVADYEPTLAWVKVDPSQMEQVILNLAINARDAMPTGGRLSIQTRNVALAAGDCCGRPDCGPGNYVVISVADTGCGMTAETQARVFEPFFTTKEVGKGTGLGLATVYGIVKQSDGCITVESQVGAGSRFEVFLPAVPENVGPSSPEPVVPPAPPGRETLLLVEDEPSVRDFVRAALESNGYCVLAASSGREALTLADAHAGTIHLVVTDVVMPQMSGRQLVEALRIRRSGIRVLYMSGYTADAVVRHGISETTEAFLQKPFSPGVLAKKVRELLDVTA